MQRSHLDAHSEPWLAPFWWELSVTIDLFASPLQHSWSFPGGSDGKESACNAGDPGLITGSGRFPAEGNDNPLQCSCLENAHGQRRLMDYSPWGRKESDMTELRMFSLSFFAKKWWCHVRRKGSWDYTGSLRDGADDSLPLGSSFLSSLLLLHGPLWTKMKTPEQDSPPTAAIVHWGLMGASLHTGEANPQGRWRDFLAPLPQAQGVFPSSFPFSFVLLLCCVYSQHIQCKIMTAFLGLKSCFKHMTLKKINGEWAN